MAQDLNFSMISGLSVVDEIEKTLDQALARFGRRQYILKSAFEGRLVPQGEGEK